MADSLGATVADYKYDGTGRRVSETRGGATTDLYYSSGWQVLEERVGGAARVQYVWSPVYVDALVLRDRDADGNGSLEERLWAQQDANFNVTALTDGTGAVVERYAYDPFGAVTVYDGSWAVRTGGSAYGSVYLYQGLRRDAATGLYHARHRDYHPALGRPLQRDPIGFAAGDANVYRWVGNGPAVRISVRSSSTVSARRSRRRSVLTFSGSRWFTGLVVARRFLTIHRQNCFTADR